MSEPPRPGQTDDTAACPPPAESGADVPSPPGRLDGPSGSTEPGRLASAQVWNDGNGEPADPDHAGAPPYPEGESDGDATTDLNVAISELEKMLDSRDALTSTDTGSALAGDEPSEPQRGEQYIIPLLEEVVIRAPTESSGVDTAHRSGALDAVGPAAGEPAAAAAALPTLTAPSRDAVSREADRYRPIFERLASEIEVIVETGIEEALKAASKEILKKVNEHVEIVLPEILDELSQVKRSNE